MNIKKCCKCQKTTDQVQFSKKQLDKAAHVRRCCLCVNDNKELVNAVGQQPQVAYKATEHTALVTNFDLVEEFRRLRAENQKYIVENADLKSKLQLQKDEIHSLYKTTIRNYELEMDSLRKENALLREENRQLKARVQLLETQIDYLMKSHVRECKIALRELLNKAERIPASQIETWPIEAKGLLTVRQSATRKDGDSAAHNVNIERIAGAVIAIPEAERKKKYESLFLCVFDKSVGSVLEDFDLF